MRRSKPVIRQTDDDPAPRHAPRCLCQEPQRCHRENIPNSPKKLPKILIRDLNSIPERHSPPAVRNKRPAATSITHQCSGKIMKPKGGGDPNGANRSGHHQVFRGNFKDFQTKFNDARTSSSSAPDGSGLLASKGGDVQIISTPNQGQFPSRQGPSSPIFRQTMSGSTPTTLKYNNRRPEYFDRLVERNQLGRNQPTL